MPHAERNSWLWNLCKSVYKLETYNEIQPFSIDSRDQLLLKKKEEKNKKVRLNYLWVNFIFKVKDFVMNSQTAVLCI